MRALIVAAALLVLCIAPPDALAGPSSQDRALAESLFREAKRLAKAGDYDTACPKFAESQRLDPQLGTLLHLATCHEQQGLTATAWAEYSEAYDRASEQGDDKRARIAKRRADALESDLSKLRLEVEDHPDGLEIVLDDVVLGEASLSSALPVDPGEHSIEARAPGHSPWRETFEIAKGSGETALTIPALEKATGDLAVDLGETNRPTDGQAPDDDTGDGQRLAGWIVGGVGVVGLALMAGFGARAASQASEADNFCEGRFCSQEGLDGHASARTSATVATVGFVLGVVGVGTGLTLLLTAPSGSDGSSEEARAKSATAFVVPELGLDRAGLRAGVTW
jgi:hypothetical protein